MMAIGQLLGESLSLGGAVVSLMSLAFVTYAIRSTTGSERPKGSEGPKRVAQTRRSPPSGDPSPLSGRNIFRNRS
ncbi:MAG: hypothetical protein NZ990_07540 [Myxococcota bacterium]|nr:hypothetical protein [Myxococcota bacterium]